MTEAVPVRRSRRAASLTAEVLWNLQIEDDKKNKEKSERKNSTSKEIEPSKRGRKRSSVDNKNEGNSQSVDTFKSVPEKKARTQNCTAFPETKPLGGGRRIHGKLTASVAPLMKSPPVAAQRTEVTHNNPILLLPVSLRSDPNPEGISLLTLQTSSDLFSCLGINNKPKVGENWGVTSITQSNTNPQGVRIGIKRCGLTLPTPHTPMYSIKTPRPHTTGQEEPLNLSVAGKQKFGFVRPVQKGDSQKGEVQSRIRKSPTTKPLNVNYNKIIPKSTHKSKPTIKAVGAHQVIVSSHQSKKCASPDYDCSSPEADDVNRGVNHTCNRPQIKLRNKAAPPRGSAEYNALVEEQRRSQAIREVEAKRRALKLRLTRTQSGNSPQSDWSSVATTPDEVNNGWEWTGSSYMGLVYSVDSGKYVKRRCFPGMRRRDEGGYTVVMVRDCVFLLAGEDGESPYLGKVTSLWEKGDQMMLSLLWYYRPEHTEDTRAMNDVMFDDELFAARHQDEISVACVEDRCHVITYSQYCRAQARLRRDGAWLKHDIRRIVPPLPSTARRCARARVRGEVETDPNNIFFCRRVYDVKMRRVLKCLPTPTSLFNDHGRKAVATSA